ncbi:MAG: hypothetical protein AB7U43_09725 [Desulfobacter sp.]
MAAHKFLKNNSGVITEESAVDSSAGAGDAGKIPALNSSGYLDSSIVNSKTSSAGAGDSGKLPALDGAGRLDASFMPTGIGADVGTIEASEALAAGDFVNIYDATGAKCRKADATVAGKEAHGFVLAAVDSGNNATVYFEGTNTQVSGQTPGRVFLATTAGQATATAPSGSGNVVQRIGIAISATAVNFQYQIPIVLA